MEQLVERFYYNKVVSCLFHTLVYCLQRELKGCESVLDLGCGPDSPIRYCGVKNSVGIEVFEPYLKESRKRGIHNRYILADVTKVDFEPKSFDAVLLVDVLEHLEKEDGRRILTKAESWAGKKVIVSTPNGFLPQRDMDENSFQKHRSGWEVEELSSLGYRAYGMAGLRFLRQENVSEKVKQEGDIFTTIRFRPRFFWLFISELTQLLTYYFPKLAFSVFYVKNV